MTIQYVKLHKDGKRTKTKYKPVIGLGNKRSSIDARPDIFYRNQWWKCKPESTVYENDGTDISGFWSYNINGAETPVSVSDGKLKTTCNNTTTLYVNKLINGLEKGKSYIAVADVTSKSGEGHLNIGVSACFESYTFNDVNAFAIGSSVLSGSSGISTVVFTAPDTSVALGLRSNDVSVDIEWDNIRIVDADIIPDTPYLTPITYLTKDDKLVSIESVDGVPLAIHLDDFFPTIIEKSAHIENLKIFVVDDDYVDEDAKGANPTAVRYNDGTIVGKTDRGRYIKYPNGVLVVYIDKPNIVVQTSNSENSVYYAPDTEFYFPVAFSSIPIANCSTVPSTNSTWTGRVRTYNDRFSVRVMGATSINKASITAVIEGRWKEV